MDATSAANRRISNFFLSALMYVEKTTFSDALVNLAY
jgi:hypothetical protein